MNTNLSDNASLIPDQLLSKPYLCLILRCFSYQTHTYSLYALSVSHVVQHPLYFLVLYLANKRWRKRTSAPGAATSPSDLLTYHSIVMQFTEFLAIVLSLCGRHTNLHVMMVVGVYIWTVTILGKSLFQLLTCVDRYLAVVHPIVYLGLKQEGRARIACIGIGCVWLVSVGTIPISLRATYQSSSVLVFNLAGLYLMVVSYCSIAVLCVLHRPGPGAVARNRQRIDQSKRRAFYTIMAIMGAMFIKFGGSLVFSGMYYCNVIKDVCVVLMSSFWTDLPNTLVLPLLFLYRERRLHSLF